MTHARTAIRKTVISLLKNSALASRIGNHIYESRVHPIDNPRSQTRQLTLIIEAYAKENGSIDVIADSLSLEIEEILSLDHTLGGMVKDIILNSTEINLSGEGDRPIAVATLTYHITYRTKEHSPNILI